MINHHPSPEMLQAYVNAELPVSIAVAVSIHLELCPSCQQKVTELEAEAANNNFALTQDQGNCDVADLPLPDLDLIEAITQDETLDTLLPQMSKSLSVADRNIKLPNALEKLSLSDWQQMGKLSRARVQLEDGDCRSSMLFIDAGGQVPQHTHKGFEITLLLDGSFSDDMGSYVKGDFIYLDGQHSHQPKTEKGCLCYTVVSDALQFQQGMSRLLNPIGKLIY